MHDYQKFKRHIASEALSLGSWIMSRDPIHTEIMADAGFDWLTVDMEHSPITLSEAADLIRTGSSRGCPMLVRLPSHDLVLAKQVLDAGAAGLIVPDVRMRTEAETLVRGIRYPATRGKISVGARGVGLGRSTGFGRHFAPYFTTWNESVVLIVQIEHVDALPEVASIAAVEGVDGLFVGPYDMSASMGIAGQLDHPQLLANVDTVIAAARATGKRAGLHSVPVDPQSALALANRGASLIAYASDVFMVRQCADDFLKAAGRIGGGSR